MSNIIDSIQLSGVTYGIKGSGGTETIELTQAQYDALAVKDPNTFYVITDATAGDLTNYYTKTETDDLLDTKLDVSAYTPTDLSNYYSKSETSGATQIQTALNGKANSSTVEAIEDSLSGYVTTDTEQDITATKTFVGEKKIKFKQSGDSNKLGFTLYNSASTNNEVASFEFRPNTFTIDNVQHPLLYFGHYRNTNTANAGVPQTVIGFRQYDQKDSAAYHYLLPLPEKAKTPFSLTTSFKDYYAPMGFKNGSTMITADNTGVVDFSDVLGGLKLVKLTQSEYYALSTKDSNTLYVIVN